MKARIIVVGLFLLLLLAVSAPYAFGCVPDDVNPSRCLSSSLFPVKPSPTAAPRAQLAVAAPAAAPVPKPTPNGLSPETARTPMWVKPEYCIEAMCPGASSAPPLNAPGGWDTIPANSSLWYSMADGHGLQVQVWILANGQQGLSLDMYAPDQQDLYGKPVGRGSFNRNFPGTDLHYSGRTWASGVWHARLTNNTSAPISFSARYTLTTPTLGNSCDNCHKLIGYNWSGCADQGFCDKLHSYYDTNPTCYDHNIDADLAGQCH